MLWCIFYCLTAPRADLTRFRQVIVLWVFTKNPQNNNLPVCLWCPMAHIFLIVLKQYMTFRSEQGYYSELFPRQVSLHCFFISHMFFKLFSRLLLCCWSFPFRRVGKGGGGCCAWFTGIEIENPQFTGIKTEFSRITHYSACALNFQPYSTTQLTCRPFWIIACILNNCFSRSFHISFV